jgi:hypothetical protein
VAEPVDRFHGFGPQTRYDERRVRPGRQWLGSGSETTESGADGDVTRRRVFDPGAVPTAFWRRDEVCHALTRRDVAELFRLFLAEFADCTQTQLALLTEHDRSDISNWVRGIRQSRVSDIEVLTRIADGLQLPDQARLLLGLAPVGPIAAPQRGHRPEARAEAAALRLAICGSRAPDTDAAAIDAAVRSLARLVMAQGYQVSHGPVGVGIEVMTYIADHYRPPDFASALGLFGHRNVVQDAAYVVVLGGASGTQTELDLAASTGKKIIPLPCTGGTARRFYRLAERDRRLRAWIDDEHFARLGRCGEHGEDFVRIVEELII